MSESTYDILDRVVSTKSGDSETVYTYDAAGRTLLINADGLNHRTVYDNYGRTVQEIEDADYNPDLDNLPNAYGDTTVGQRYFYNEYGDLDKEINRYDLQTDYYYSDDGLLFIKVFDIYDYYYDIKGNIDHIDVNGYTAVSYAYNISDKNIKVGSGQSLNSITYANGYTEKQLVDESGNVLAKYRNNETEPYYFIYAAGEKSVSYENTTIGVKGLLTTIVSENDSVRIQSKPNEMANTGNVYYQYYSQSKTDDAVTISQHDFYSDFYRNETIKDNSIAYSSKETPEYICYYTNDENAAGQTVKKEELTIFDSAITYDETNDSFEKSYYKYSDTDIENLAAFSYIYDDDGNIIEDENNQYTYNDLGALTETTGSVNSSYTYDDRGNITSKTVDGVTTTFSYDNTWWDQLVSVNDEALTYDANGNLTSYGERSYEWSNGKQLSQITDGENTYSYSYDENGIRWQKKVNGEDIRINTLNGRVVAQRTGLTPMYFQYDKNGTPFGFIYRDEQYFYITNLSGDVVGITDADGNKIASYTYDAWGKLLDITATDMDIAESNPLRYRGYYYDNETGYYYLQSRYYDPELGRFISADGFEYLDTSNRLNSNAYIYCWNCPTAFEDAEGTTPKLSADKQTIFDFLSNISSRIRERISARFQNLQSDFNASVEMLKFYYMNPGELTSDILSGLFGKEVHIEFKLLKEIRSKFVSFLQNVNELLKNLSDKSSNEEEGIVSYSSDSSCGSGWGSPFHVISVLIAEISNFMWLEDLAAALGKIFSFDNLWDFMIQKVEIFKEAFDAGIVAISTASKSFASDLAAFFSGVMGIFGIFKELPDSFSNALSALPYVTNAINDFSGRYSPVGALLMLIFDSTIGLIVDIGGMVIDSFVLGLGSVFTFLSDWLYNIDSVRDKAEFFAYNWYYVSQLWNVFV